jgi:membrane fusion protein (multidrug efflux system)
MTRHTRIGSTLLLVAILSIAGALGAWKHASLQAAEAAAASQLEPVESVTAVLAERRDYQPKATAIGTVLALRSITLRNELAGTVRETALAPGRIVEAGEVLVALDVAVEQAELVALQAEGEHADGVLARAERLRKQNALSQEEFDRAFADRDITRAQIARTRAIIERKTIRAPFRARVGIADVHPGQYLNEGTLITSLQGIDDAAHVDFAVEQQVAARLSEGDSVEVTVSSDRPPLVARIVAVDVRVDPATRNAMVRARIEDADPAPTPGASVRVRVPAGTVQSLVSVPASAVRKGPAGDHVFVLADTGNGSARAETRPVSIVAQLGDEALIGDGLAAGERVAASGSFKLREDVLVALAGDTVSTGTGGGI